MGTLRGLFASGTDWVWVGFLVCFVLGLVLFAFGALAVAAHRAARHGADSNGGLGAAAASRGRRLVVPPGSQTPTAPPRIATVSLLIGAGLLVSALTGAVAGLSWNE